MVNSSLKALNGFSLHLQMPFKTTREALTSPVHHSSLNSRWHSFPGLCSRYTGLFSLSRIYQALPYIWTFARAFLLSNSLLHPVFVWSSPSHPSLEFQLKHYLKCHIHLQSSLIFLPKSVLLSPIVFCLSTLFISFNNLKKFAVIYLLIEFWFALPT